MPRREQPHPADLAIGAVLRRRREAARMSLADVGRELERPYQMVQRHESAEIRLSYSRLTEIAAALKASPSEIVAEATGERPGYDKATERAMIRIALRLTKVPPGKREAATATMLKALGQFLAELPDEA